MALVSPRVNVGEAVPADYPSIREMLQEYAAWLAIDLSYQDFAREVRDLPGEYARPRGGLFIARKDEESAGMVAFRPCSDGRAEMKRLYVRPRARGSGAGYLLVERALAEARAAGYEAMILDTLPVMGSAQRLYERFGFRDVAPYYESPVAGTRYMALNL